MLSTLLFKGRLDYKFILYNKLKREIKDKKNISIFILNILYIIDKYERTLINNFNDEFNYSDLNLQFAQYKSENLLLDKESNE